MIMKYCLKNPSISGSFTFIFFGLFFNIMISYREYEGLQITVTGGFTV